MTTIEIVIYAIRPSEHKIKMHSWTLEVDNAAATERKLKNTVMKFGRILKEKDGFG